jgi:hypothetical protein
MNDTPETDNERTLKLALEVFTELANTLKQERDEARELLASEKITRNNIIEKGVAIEKERDEAIELLIESSAYSNTASQENTEKFLRKIGKWEDVK